MIPQRLDNLFFIVREIDGHTCKIMLLNAQDGSGRLYNVKKNPLKKLSGLNYPMYRPK